MRVVKADKLKKPFDFLPEDNAYMLRPIEWYFKSPLFGFKKLYYLGDAFDCDDFCDVFKVECLKRHLKGAGAYMEGEAYPALPMFRAKVDVGGNVPHWCFLVICQDGYYFIERKADRVDFVKPKKVYVVYGL